MSDATAKKMAASIRGEFWRKFESALEPKLASKRAYLEELEELVTDAEGRIDAVKEEIAAEEGESEP